MKDRKQLTLMGLCLVAMAGVLVLSAVAFAAPDAAISRGGGGEPAATADPAAVADTAPNEGTAAPGTDAPQTSLAPAPVAPAGTPAPAPETPAVTPAPAPAPAPASADTGAASEITEAAAKSAALTHAGLTEGEITFTKCKLDWEDGRRIYEVEFYAADGAEYEYELDAATGAVLKADYDGAQETASAGAQAVEYMDQTQAKQIALDRVPGAAASHLCKWELDHDDCAYEGEIVYNGCAYNFKLDACTGAMLEWGWEHCDNGHHAGRHHR